MTDSGSLHQRLEALSPARRLLLARRLGTDVTVPGSGARLAACVAPTSGAVIDHDAIRAYVRQRLPDYMVPQIITVVAALPRTAGGKIDRRALDTLATVPAAGDDIGQHGFVAAQTEAEKTLATIWCEVLGLDTVGVHDDFFEVGGDSLLSIRILSRASKAGLSLDPETFFLNPSIAAQAALVEAPAAIAEAEVPAQTDETPARKFPLADLSDGEMDGLSRMLDDLDSDK